MPKNRITTDGILYEILQERVRQDKQWGGPHHDDQHTYKDWLGFIRKQLNEILSHPGDKAALDEAMKSTFKDSHTGREFSNLQLFEERMVKVAALAVAAIQSERRKAGRC